MDFVFSTSIKNNSKVGQMFGSFFQMSRQGIQIYFSNIIYVVKHIGHGPPKCFSNIFKTERSFLLGKNSPQPNENYHLLVLRSDLNLVIVRESIHEGKYLTYNRVIDGIINERSRVIVFQKSLIQIMKIGTHSNVSLLISYWNKIGYPFGQQHKIDESLLKQFFNINFNHG